MTTGQDIANRYSADDSDGSLSRDIDIAIVSAKVKLVTVLEMSLLELTRLNGGIPPSFAKTIIEAINDANGVYDYDA